MPTVEMESTSAVVLRQLLGGRGGLISYIRMIVRDLDMAEDIYQEVCVTVLRKQHEITPGPALEGYFRKVARHAALEALERSGKRPVSYSPELLDALDRAWSDKACESPSGKLDALRQCVDKLPPKSRRLLSLRYESHLSGRLLAEQIGYSPKAAYVALSRVHRALRICVQQGSFADGSAL